MDPVKYLNQFRKFGSEGGFKPGLERIEYLVSAFNHPENDLKIIHVAGTNGKGSTISFLKNIYKKAGFRVGVYTSPPLMEFNERIMINNEKISNKELKNIIKEVEPVLKKMEKDPNINTPSFFEMCTFIAFLYFKRKEVDMVLLEVGLGGRFDATNIIEKPLAAVITNISLEHTDILGDSISSIAREKAGIIKNKIPVLTSVKKNSALEVIKNKIKKQKSYLISIDKKYKWKLIFSSLDKQKFYVYKKKEKLDLEIKLPGLHQIRNALLALAVVEELNNFLPVSTEEIRNGLIETKWPGRVEILSKKPLLILDGAHNEDSIKQLVNTLKKQINSKRKINIILSILKDKDIKSILELLNFRNKNLQIIITKNNNSRAAKPEVIKRIADKIGLKNYICKDIKKILPVINKGSRDEIFVITGSLYTVAEFKKINKNI